MQRIKSEWTSSTKRHKSSTHSCSWPRAGRAGQTQNLPFFSHLCSIRILLPECPPWKVQDSVLGHMSLLINAYLNSIPWRSLFSHSKLFGDPSWSLSNMPGVLDSKPGLPIPGTVLPTYQGNETLPFPPTFHSLSCPFLFFFLVKRPPFSPAFVLLSSSPVHTWKERRGGWGVQAAPSSDDRVSAFLSF